VSYDEQISGLARQQHGLVHIGQLAEIGLKRYEIDWRLERGLLERTRYGVLRVAGTPNSWHGELLGACWAGGPRALASHRSAAALWDLPGMRSDIVEITCPRWRRARHHGVIVHESKALDKPDVSERCSIPLTTVERTLVDLGAVGSPIVVEMALDNALRRGLVTYRSVFKLLDRIGAQGRNGVGVLRQILRERDLTRQATESPKETELLRLLRAAGLPTPVPQFEIYDSGRFLGRVDFAYPGARIAIEYNSKAHHVGGVEMENDSARQNRLVGAGWTVLIATQRDLNRGGRDLCRAIRAGLDRSGVRNPVQRPGF
jgi:very-short-patch-repair endonuclease